MEKEYNFPSSITRYYPIPLQKEDSDEDFIRLYFKGLALIDNIEYDNLMNKYKEDNNLVDVLKLVLTNSDNNGTFPLGFKKEKDITELVYFNKTDFKLKRDKGYLKAKKSCNFIVSASVHSGNVYVKALSFENLFASIRKIALNKESFNKETVINFLNNIKEEGIVPLKYGIIKEKEISLTDLVKYFVRKISPADLEKILITAKTTLLGKKSIHNNNILELKGETIRYFYNVKNYVTDNIQRNYMLDGISVLHNSCMRHDTCYQQLEIYSKNPESISLLVLLDSKSKKKIRARSILWTSVTGEKAIDRIYSFKQVDADTLVSYCKAKGYSTVYKNNESTYGLPRMKNVVIKLEYKDDSLLPYFDTMSIWERLQGLLSNNGDDLVKYCEDNNLDYIITNKGGGWSNRVFDSTLKIKGKKNPDFLRSIDGSSLKERRVVAIEYPKKGYSSYTDMCYIGNQDNYLRTTVKILESLNAKYNCIKKALYRIDANTYLLYQDDKVNLVYSKILNSYIDKSKSYFNYTIGSYIYKESYNDPIINEKYILHRLKKIYGGKIVSINKKGYENLKDISKKLTIPLSLTELRPSRKFRIKFENIDKEGVLIKGILIPFKHLKVIKHNG